MNDAMRFLEESKDWWILNENREPLPATFFEWKAWHDAQPGDHPRLSIQVARDCFEGEPHTVSTIFLPHDHGWGIAEKPVLWETMIFATDGRPLHQECERYTSEAEALEGHARWVAHVLQLGGKLIDANKGAQSEK